ncbi:MAG: exosome complex RNA-binding protein Csl4 [Rhabdochlamydiaceae bacterium]
MSNRVEVGERKRLRIVLPGDKLATIEEFIPGTGSASIDDEVVSTVLGGQQPDMSNRIMNVKPARTAADSLPKAGDNIIGRVDSAQSSVAQVTIIALNDKPSHKEFSGMLSLRDDRRRRSSSPIKAADLIRAKVISTKNSIFHLSIDASDCGVIYTVCSNCGGRVVALGRDRVKCPECGLVDERVLADDFVKLSRTQANS